MTLTQEAIYLQKSLKVIVPESGECSRELVGTFAKNLHALGFGLSPTLIERLCASDQSTLTELYKTAVPVLKEMVGAHKTWEPMYPNFPKQVAEASDAELWINAMVHYFGFVMSDMMGDPTFVMLPQYEKQERPELDEYNDLRWIDLGDEADFDATFTRLAGSNASLSETDKEILAWFCENRDVSNLMPGSIPQKETLAFLVSKVPDRDALVPAIKTATDTLRVAVALSEGDVSLAVPTKFRNFNKAERRFLLGCLENCGDSLTEDMLRWKTRWIRLGERLHPGDFKERFPKTIAAFDVIRNNTPFQTYNSKVEAAIAARDAEQTVALLQKRPGDFTRRLDHILRTHDQAEIIVDEYLANCDDVSTPVLLQAWKHFAVRPEITDRAFFPKGSVSKVQFKEGGLPSLDEGARVRLVQGIEALLEGRFSQLPELGKVYVGESLKTQIVPFSQRSASRSLQTVVRGSSFSLPDEKSTVRFFIWWKNIKGSRVDLDLSATIFKEDWSFHDDVAYYNLRSAEMQAYHSGDITSAPKGACEFIDINLPSVVKSGGRYIVASVYSFTHQPFDQMPECFGGWMLREQPQSGEIFNAKTVQEKVDVTSPTIVVVPVIIDAVERRVIWADLGLKSMAAINCARNSTKGMSQIGRALVGLKKPTLHDLFTLHARGRGEIVDNREDADTVFDTFDGTVTAFDIDTITSEYLA